jgi:hypothetical protein
MKGGELPNYHIGKSGYYGVCWNESAKKWAVQIRIGKKVKYLGVYNDILEAARAYDREAQKYGKVLLNNV